MQCLFFCIILLYTQKAYLYGNTNRVQSIVRLEYVDARVYGTVPEWVCEILTGSTETQPTAKQIAVPTASVAAYDKWDKVLEVFRQEVDPE